MKKTDKIPSGWSNVELKAVTKNISVGIATEVRPYVRPSGVPIIRNQNIRENRFDDTDIIFISEDFDRKNKNKRVRKNDVLIVRTGSNTGQACTVPEVFENSQTFTTLIVRPSELLDSQYLSLHINSFGIREVDRLSAGGGKPNLNAGFLKGYRILLPPIDEQKAIAKILVSFDIVIGQNNKLIAQKELRKKWLIQNLLTGRKRLKGYECDWKELRLGQMFTERNETRQSHLPLLSLGANGIYPQSDSIKKDTSNEDKSKYRRICPGDIGYNTMRMWQGRSALSKLEGIVSPAYTVVVPRQNADSLFFSFLFKTSKSINLFWRKSQGLVDDTLNCKFKDFAIVKVMLPPTKDEQSAIAQIILAAEKEIQLLKTKTNMLRKQKKGMMQVLLTGKIRLKLGDYEDNRDTNKV
jgi:restriction endonuclease S subunit